MSVPESSEDLAFRPGQSWRSEWREKTLPIPVRETGQRTEFFVKGQKWHHFHHHFTKNLTKKNSIAWNLLESLVTNQACQLSTVTNLCLSRWVGQMPSSVMLPASRYQGPKDPSCFNDSTKWRYMEDLCISLQIWIERFSLRAESVFSHGTLLRKFHHPSICGSATTFPADFQTSFITWHQFTTDNAWRNQFHLRMHCDFETAITMMLAWCLYPPHLRSRSVQGFADRLKTCCDWVWFKQDYCT